MKRATIVWVDLSDASPPEMGKQRPAIVVSNSTHNAVLNSVVVVPLSSRAPEIAPLRIKLDLGSIRQPGFAVLPGIRQVKTARLQKVIGQLSAKEMEKLEEAMWTYLAD